MNCTRAMQQRIIKWILLSIHMNYAAVPLYKWQFLRKGWVISHPFMENGKTVWFIRTLDSLSCGPWPTL